MRDRAVGGTVRDSPAIRLFHENWFLREAQLPEITLAEKRLIEAAMGPDPGRWDGQPDLARMTAILAGNPDVLDRIGAHLLTVIVGMRGCGGAVSFLLDRGVPFNIDTRSYNVLHEAAWAGSADTLEAVFTSGAADATPVSVDKPHTGWPANLSLMYWAAWGGFPEVARLLIDYGVGIHHERPIKGNGERGVTSLHEAVSPGLWGDDESPRNQGKREVARMLIEDGAAYDACAAAGLDDTGRLKALQAFKPDLADTTGPYGMTPLHWASRAGSLDSLRWLLDHGAEVDTRNDAHRTSIQLASECGRAEAVKLLAAAGADLDTQDRKGRTPLHRATYEGHAEAAEALLAAGADTTVLNRNGKTAFEIARKGASYLKKRT
ncbi:MAG: ankyrin repeat domain-containing protein [Gemmatimonadetes bacterium]|nr:ankyrin repeat domain-containing protein [Gemmatimonadota bacterium]MYB60636.1 ankyrin repeat domain-containing protein [Gemmatimonadota bacterium]